MQISNATIFARTYPKIDSNTAFFRAAFEYLAAIRYITFGMTLLPLSHNVQRGHSTYTKRRKETEGEDNRTVHTQSDIVRAI